MLIDKLELKGSGEEVPAHETQSFPHSSYYVEPEKFPGKIIPWHWHEDVEVMYIVQGSMELKIASNSYTVSAGDSVFINTNVLHFQKPIGSTKVITLNQVFNASVIYGDMGSVFYLKYVRPILSCKDLDVLLFSQSTTRGRKISELIRLSQDLSDEAKPGFEIEVRNALSSMWLLLLESAADKLDAKQSSSVLGEDRLKKMMDYLHHHYMDKVTLKEIASAANISEREAIRTFNNILGFSPFAYLQDYRVRKASFLLLGTQNSISQIAYDCGFSSMSFFGKEFKKATNMTPSEYRRQNAGKKEKQ